MKEKLQEIITEQCIDVTLYGVGEKSGVVAKNMVADPTIFVAKVLDVIIEEIKSSEEEDRPLAANAVSDRYDTWKWARSQILSKLTTTKEQLLFNNTTE